jgi:hypothetical protein
MKRTRHFLASFGTMALLVILSVSFASAQTNLAKAIQHKLAAKATKLENHAAEDKISTIAFDLEEAATDIQLSGDNLKDAISACRAEITGVCGKALPGEGRIAACLVANKSMLRKTV